MFRAVERVAVCWRSFEMITAERISHGDLRELLSSLKPPGTLTLRGTIAMACVDLPGSSGEGVKKADSRIHRVRFFFVQAGATE